MDSVAYLDVLIQLLCRTNSILMEPFNNAAFGKSSAKDGWKNYRQADEKRINDQHRPNHKVIGKEPKAACDRLHNDQREQHPNDQRGYNCSHSIIQTLTGQHPFELSACHANTLEHSKFFLPRNNACQYRVDEINYTDQTNNNA